MIPDTEIVKLEIEKISPQLDDVICLKFPKDCFEGVKADQIKKLGENLKNIFQNYPILIMSKETDLTTLNKAQLKEAGLQKIEKLK